MTQDRYAEKAKELCENSHNPSFGFTHPYSYDPNCRCEDIAQALREVAADAIEEAAQVLPFHYKALMKAKAKALREQGEKP